MTSMLMPYFMENPDWYIELDLDDPRRYASGHERGYILTENATAEAIQSYEEFFAALDRMDE